MSARDYASKCVIGDTQIVDEGPTSTAQQQIVRGISDRCNAYRYEARKDVVIMPLKCCRPLATVPSSGKPQLNRA